MVQDPLVGVIVSGSSLAMQKVSRDQAGSYICIASNLEGDTESNSLELKILCKLV